MSPRRGHNGHARQLPIRTNVFCMQSYEKSPYNRRIGGSMPRTRRRSLGQATNGASSAKTKAATFRAWNRKLSPSARSCGCFGLANEELERLVVRDTLTPLYNRRHFITCLVERLNRLERYGTASALVFVDVDGMKSINDTFGHSAGRLCAQPCRASADRGDPLDRHRRAGRRRRVRAAARRAGRRGSAHQGRPSQQAHIVDRMQFRRLYPAAFGPRSAARRCAAATATSPPSRAPTWPCTPPKGAPATDRAGRTPVPSSQCIL